MGGIAEIQESIRNQFISLFDSVLFIAEHSEGTNEQAFKILKAKLLDRQIHLLLVDEFELMEIPLFQDDYEAAAVEYDGKYITVSFICNELQKSIINNSSTADIKNYGFGLQRFIHTVHNNLGITIPNELFLKAQSPDCYHDDENPLTPVVKELQAENTRLKIENNQLKQAPIIMPTLEGLGENYITLNEVANYLQRSLDLSVIDPINFLEPVHNLFNSKAMKARLVN